MPTPLAIIYAETGKTMDAQALRATGSPPPGTAREQVTRLLLSGVCDERQVFVGLRNMFMQSGVPAAMGYELISIPGNGLCVWLVTALLAVRRDARRIIRAKGERHAARIVHESPEAQHGARDAIRIQNKYPATRRGR